MGVRGEVFTTRAVSGKRTFFFNVKENRHGEPFLNIVESRKSAEESFERQQIVVYHEDVAVFLENLQASIDFMKTHYPERKVNR